MSITNKYMYILIIVLAVLFIWTVGSYLVIRNLEEPNYTVVSKNKIYEIREYDSYIVAETTVTGSYREALNEGFGNIANYIFGDNSRAEKIAMTAPVLEGQEIESDSEKITMTVPVLNAGDDSERVVSFVMPSKYTIENIPKPNNSNVTLREVPKRKVASLRYTWYTNGDRVISKSETLLAALKKDEVIFVGKPVSAQYNPPLSIPFMRRNEILIEVK